MGFTHGLEDKGFQNDLPVKSISESTPRRSQLLQEDPHHIAVGSQSSQLPVGSYGFRSLIKNGLRLRQQCTKFHGTERSQHLFKQRLKVLASFGKFGDNSYNPCRIIAEHGADQRVQIPPVSQTEKRKNLSPGNGAAISPQKEGDHLIQERLSVTHTAFCGAGDGSNSFGFNRHILSSGDE